MEFTIMASVNKVILIGNLVRDPETRAFPDGSPVCNISIACNEKYKDKNGEAKELVEYVNIVFFGKLAEIASKYLTKGGSVYVEGKLKTEKYNDKNGIEKYSTKVVASTMTMLGGKSETKPSQPQELRPAASFDDMDSDIPF